MSSNVCREPEHKVYPELLIAISHDMFHDIEKESPLVFGVNTISHVLIVYNIVDMLFRYVESVGIFLNIAGIVIEGTKNEWGFQNKTEEHEYIDGDIINDLVSEYFRSAEYHIPRHSYDYVIYNARMRINKRNGNEVLGIATMAGLTPMFFPHDYPYRYNAALEDSESYEHFATVAHELAHIFGAEHDQSYNWFFVPACERTIMAARDCSSKRCTRWSTQVEEQLKKFFNSAAHCILKNKPRSLFPPGPRLMLTQQEQCNCHGYKSFDEAPDGSYESRCHMALRCIDENGEVNRELPQPLDGSDCSRDKTKVCWDEYCVRIP